MVQRHKVTQFYTAPTAIRALMSFGPEIISNYDLSSLRVLGSVGEPINPEAWRWYDHYVRVMGARERSAKEYWGEGGTGRGSVEDQHGEPSCSCNGDSWLDA